MDCIKRAVVIIKLVMLDSTCLQSNLNHLRQWVDLDLDF